MNIQSFSISLTLKSKSIKSIALFVHILIRHENKRQNHLFYLYKFPLRLHQFPKQNIQLLLPLNGAKQKGAGNPP
jgi:hypothetical protein